MNKKISLGAAIAFMLIVAGITFCITMMVSLEHFNDKVLNVKEREEMYKKIAEVDRNARQNYAGEIDEEYLANEISRGFIRGLDDKYASYLTQAEYDLTLQEQQGKRVQVGITMVKDTTGYFKVTSLVDNSPAILAGIAVGDLLVSFDDKDLKTYTQLSAQRLLEGENGSQISILYRRDGIDFVKTMQRKDLTYPYVTSQLYEDTGYLKIENFTSQAFTQFRTQVNSLIQRGANALIFDVRDNSTGDLETAVAMLDLILPSGELGFRVSSNGQKTLIDESDPYEISVPIVTIVNSKTSNVAEYFVATLRDFGVSNSVGVQTAGKSVELSLIKLLDGSAISVTTSYILPPSQNKIEGVGIKPDYEVKLTAEQETSLTSLSFEEDAQLQKALDVVNSKKE